MARAAAPPVAGELLRQVSPRQRPLERLNPRVELKQQQRSQVRPKTSVEIHVNTIRITGATQFPVGTLHALVAAAEGKTLGLARLKALARRITDYYRAHGYLLSRAYVPPQAIRQGVVRIAVLEGRLDKINVDNAAGLHGFALAPLEVIPTGEVLTADALQRGLLLTADNPGVRVIGRLEPGAEVGTSTLHARIEPDQRVSGFVGLDDYGNDYTGTWRVRGGVQINEPLHLGDRLSLAGLVSLDNLYYLRGAYDLPITPWGTRAGVAYSYLGYELGDDFAALDASGDAGVASLWLEQPIVRSRDFNLDFRVQYEHKDLEDKIDRFDLISNTRINAARIGFNGGFTDDFLAGAITRFHVAYTIGDVALAPARTRNIDAATVGTQGSFDKLTLGVERLQRLNGFASLYLSYTAQFTSDNLDSAERIALGGMGAVRAYPQGAAAADQAQLITVEGRFDLPQALFGQWQLVAFVDYGHAKLRHDPVSSRLDNTRDLAGAGVGFNVAPGYGLLINASVAWPLGDDDAYADDTDDPNAWLSVAKTF